MTSTFHFTVASTYARPGDPAPFVGKVAAINVDDALNRIFERGGNNPFVAPFDGWAQPSVSVRDQITVWEQGDGPGAVQSFTVAGVGFTSTDDHDIVRRGVDRLRIESAAYEQACLAIETRQRLLREARAEARVA